MCGFARVEPLRLIQRSLYLGLCALLFWGGSVVAVTFENATPALLLNGFGAKELDVTTYFQRATDANGTLKLNDIITDFDRLDFNKPPVSFNKSQITWMKMRVGQGQLFSEPLPRQWYLVLEAPHVLSATFYSVKDQDDLNPRDRVREVAALPDRFLVYPIPVNPHSVMEVYLRIETATVFNAPIKIWDATEYQVNKRKILPGWGLFYGAMLALFLYNLVVAAALREGTYLFLSVFLLCSSLISGYEEGFLNLYFPFFSSVNHVLFGWFVQCVALLCATGFAKMYLSTKQLFPILNVLLTLSMVAAGFLSVAVVFDVLSVDSFALLFLFAGGLFFLPCAVALLSNSSRATRYFLVGWSVFILGYAIYQLGQIDFIPINYLTQHIKEASLCFLGVSLSLGIAAQIHEERFEKQKGLELQREMMLELQYAEEQIQKKVLRDTVQGYPGFESLKDVAESTAHGLLIEETFILVLVELQYLDLLEKQLGHAARNELITRATKRLSVVLLSAPGVITLKECSAQVIPMAILGTGTYAFMLKNIEDVNVNAAVDQVEKAMLRPFYYQGVALQPGIAFGVARSSGSREKFETLFQHCVIALNADKDKNLKRGNNFESYDQYNPRNIEWVNALRESVQQGEIELYFQAIYDVRTAKVCSVEVLSRWENELSVDINPNEIFYLAEVGGFVAELTLSVIEKAIQNFKASIFSLEMGISFSVNLSPKCLREESFIDGVTELLQLYNIPKNTLSFEIKESAIIEDPSITREVLLRLRGLGIGLIIDEFGAAYSNSSYLSSLPVTEVKLDPRIVSRIDQHDDYQLVLSVISLCKQYDITLVVHGVEDESTMQKLEQMGCTFAQGHYFSRPVRAADFKIGRMLRKPRVKRLDQAVQ